jgi:sugar (pentulose or hexulose) kinase
MDATPVIAVIDVGRTNKKIFLFDERYSIVYERSAFFDDIKDEDGFPCEDVQGLTQWMMESLRSAMKEKTFNVRAVNFTAYGASLVFVDERGDPLCPLYNYLKPFPEFLSKKFYSDYGGEENLSIETASPVLGSLNSGLQLYRLKHERPSIFEKLKYALHLPQYLSSVLTKEFFSDVTSIGCHTNLWDFRKHEYHEWVHKEGIDSKLAPIADGDTTVPIVFGGRKMMAGIGLHDSSAALIPYLLHFKQPFVLISSGTWCISLNPFNDQVLTEEELKQDCLCYLQYQGRPVKASRLFAGSVHEEGIKRIADHFHLEHDWYKAVRFDPEVVAALKEGDGHSELPGDHGRFTQLSLESFPSANIAYHQLMIEIINAQHSSTMLVMNDDCKRIFVDGGFSANPVYMNLLAAAFPKTEVYAASMAQATALGAALAIHSAWNNRGLAPDMIRLQHYAAPDPHGS